MIFSVIAPMTKQEGATISVRCSSLVTINATSEAEAKGRFIESSDVVEHIQSGWILGRVTPAELPPQTIFQDADFINVLKEAVQGLINSATYNNWRALDSHERYMEAKERAEKAEATLTPQPIETAPKDGTQILLYPRDGDGDICTGRWATWRDGDSGWAAGGGWYEADEVSHWLPIPAALSPAAEQADDEKGVEG